MIIVITHIEKDKTGRDVRLASHGVDSETLRTVCLPAVPPEELGCVFDPDIGELVIR